MNVLFHFHWSLITQYQARNELPYAMHIFTGYRRERAAKLNSHSHTWRVVEGNEGIKRNINQFNDFYASKNKKHKGKRKQSQSKLRERQDERARVRETEKCGMGGEWAAARAWAVFALLCFACRRKRKLAKCAKNKITEIKNGRTRGSFKSCHKHLIRSKHDLKAAAKRISHFAISSLPRVQIKSEFNCRQELSQQWLIDFFTNEIALGSPFKEVQPFNPQHFLPSLSILHPLLWAAVAAAAVALSQRLINVTDICQVGFHNFVRFPSPAY